MSKRQDDMMFRIPTTLVFLVALAFSPVLVSADDPPDMSEQARQVRHDPSAFGPDPDYEDKPYDIEQQLAIYGGKRAVENPRPMLEWGRRIYESGPLRRADKPPSDSLNPWVNQFAVYGDIRTAFAYSDITPGGSLGQVAVRANIDIDWKLTGTERIHAFIRPFDSNRNGVARITGCEVMGSLSSGDCRGEFDADIDALFFEGDLGAIASAERGSYVSWDLPFAIGLMPLLMQNGVWLEDAFTGFAFTIPARNSARLDISNYDLTFFAGFDRVNSGALGGATGAKIYGAAAFIEANQGYWEVGYAYTDASKVDSDLNYSNFTVAFTRRYWDRLSNSVRVIVNFGQDVPQAQRTADGYLLLVENSLVTQKPLTLVPYFNLFYGKDSPQSLARAVDAGGVLKNTGITFESDGMTGFPTLDASARNTFGGAIGVQYLFNLDRQVVFEVAGVRPHGDPADAAILRGQVGAGIRFQQVLSRAWLMRLDGIWADTGADTEIRAGRVEFRRKF